MFSDLYIIFGKLRYSFFRAIKKVQRKQILISLLIIAAIFVFKALFAEYYGFSLNPTKSIKGNLFLYSKDHNFRAKKGDLLVFAVADNDLYYPKKELVKFVAGVGGNIININGRSYIIDDIQVIAKEYSLSGQKLNQFRPQGPIIPKNSYFVVGANPNSYDSRYIGFVNQNQVIGKAWVIF